MGHVTTERTVRRHDCWRVVLVRAPTSPDREQVVICVRCGRETGSSAVHCLDGNDCHPLTGPDVHFAAYDEIDQFVEQTALNPRSDVALVDQLHALGVPPSMWAENLRANLAVGKKYVFILFRHRPQETPELQGVFSTKSLAISQVDTGSRLWVPHADDPHNIWVQDVGRGIPNLYVHRLPLDELTG